MLRVVVLVNAVALNVYRADNFGRPALGVAAVAVMVGWTAFATWAYADAGRRGPLLLGTDLAVAVLMLASSPVAKGEWFNASVPGFWVMGALLAWAIRFKWGGLIAGVVLAGVDLLVRDEITQSNYGNAFLLLIGGPIVGYVCGSLQDMAAERDRAQSAAAAATERARLARAVHDGVLQVLALVQRRGAELGGEAAALGRLAGEQEAALRQLIRTQDAVRADVPGGTTDLAGALAALGTRPGVQVAVPPGAVPLPPDRAAEVLAVVEAVLDNVARHVGEAAPAWVLLEAGDDVVEVSVRDEGPGIPDGRLEAAATDGRLGVSQSIRGRVTDLGGTATVTSGAGGTEWEIVVPRTAGP